MNPRRPDPRRPDPRRPDPRRDSDPSGRADRDRSDCALAIEVFQDVLARRGEADDLSAAGDAITGAPKDASMPERVLRHFEECIACREDAQSIGALDRSLRRGFRAIAEGIPLPSEDAIARMLREVGDAPRAGILRRIRRTLNPTLWIVFWLLALLSACALFALAYRAIEG